MFYDCPFLNNYYRNDTNKSEIINEQKLMPDKCSIAYPFINNDKVNPAIINEVSKLFTAQVLLPEKVDFKEIYGVYDIMLNQDNLLSILFSIYTYVDRAAHGYTAYSSLTINTATGKSYNFSDLFNPSIYYVGVLNELAKEYIKENNVALINEYNGITPNQMYYLTPTSLVLYYQVYDYTPYVYGLFKIEIPYDKIKNILSPASPIKMIIT